MNFDAPQLKEGEWRRATRLPAPPEAPVMVVFNREPEALDFYWGTPPLASEALLTVLASAGPSDLEAYDAAITWKGHTGAPRQGWKVFNVLTELSMASLVQTLPPKSLAGLDSVALTELQGLRSQLAARAAEDTKVTPAIARIAEWNKPLIIRADLARALAKFTNLSFVDVLRAGDFTGTDIITYFREAAKPREAKPREKTVTPVPAAAPNLEPPEQRAARFTELFAPLANSEEDRALVAALAARVTSISDDRRKVVFDDIEMNLAEPRTPAADVPASYGVLARRFSSAIWDSPGGGDMGYLGIREDGTLAGDGGWECDALNEGGNSELLEQLATAGKSLHEIQGAFACGQNWILFDPLRNNELGEAALAFVSHEDCRWVPITSADALSAGAFLLRMMARAFLDRDDLVGEIYS